MKHKLGVCTKEELENTLVEALHVNNFVPYLMLQSENSALKSPEYVSPGSMDEAVDYVISAVGTWRRTAGLIDWLEELKAHGGPKPADDGTLLFKLLTKGKLLVVVKRRGKSNEMHEITTRVEKIPGTGLESFSLPPGMKEHDPLKIVCYNTGEQVSGHMDKGGFISFSYDDVKEVHFWSLLQSSESFGKDLGGHSCRECYKAANFRCSKCGVVWYCSKECQRKNWKTQHKRMCNKLIKT